MTYKKLFCIMLATVLLLSPVQTAKAAGEDVKCSDSGIAGMTRLLDDYYNNRPQGETSEFYVNGKQMQPAKRTPSQYELVAIADVTSYVNIRSGPSTKHTVVGKLYAGGIANILGYEGDWVKIQSGNLEEGYIKADYLKTGWDAEEKIKETYEKVAIVTCSVLNVRSGQSTSSKVCGKVYQGESYEIVKEYENWVEIVYQTAEQNGKAQTGYVHKDYVNIDYEFRYAVTIEEERAQKEAEAAAKKAAEEAAKKAAEEAAAKKAAEEAAKKEAAAAKLRKQVVDYALKFVGNPYVWGGTSLTKGADCSGFVQSVYKYFGYTLPRVSKDQAVSAGYMDVIPDKEHLLPGDLIFYTNDSGVVDHVALYIGDGKIVHAASSKTGIIISKYTTRVPYKARRVIE